MAKDVLEVLRRLDNALLSRRATPQECVDFNEAVEAVAELIAADVECDEALNACDWTKAKDAQVRRRAALAACRGL